MSSLSVIVLVHDKVALSVECLAALAETLPAGMHAEVLCVDNASTEDVTPLREAGARFERFRLLQNDRNLTFSDANNRAVAAAGGRRLLFLNNDVLLRTATVQALMTALDDPRTGVAGARLLYPGRQRVQHAGLVPMLWGYVSNFGVGARATDARFLGVHERPAVSGAALAIDRALFLSVGGFDETFRWGYEDVDLCFRVRGADRQIVCVGDGESEHHESATLRGLRQPANLPANYAAYRRAWHTWLAPREAAYVDTLRRDRVQRVAIVGAGLAARGLGETLAAAGIEIAAFATTRPRPDVTAMLGRPVVSLDDLKALRFDRLMIGSQFFFDMESSLADLDPCGQPLFPVIWD